jgi:myo-inositol-1(or 4)-monophosphatase
MGQLRSETAVAIRALVPAMELALSRVGAAEVRLKTGRDVVTATDIAIEDQVRAAVVEATGAAVAGEERGEPVARAAECYWIVDPICGTRNFASGIPLYCINLAWVEGGQVSAAVIGDPSTGDVLVAQTGGGAWAFNDTAFRALHVSAESQILIVEDSHASGDRREQAAKFLAGAVRAHRWELRSLSTTLSLAYLAAGRAAGYVLFWTSAVHAAAGSLVAKEAGATVTDIQGRDWSLESASLLAAADPALHEDLLILAQQATA